MYKKNRMLCNICIGFSLQMRYNKQNSQLNNNEEEEKKISKQEFQDVERNWKLNVSKARYRKKKLQRNKIKRNRRLIKYKNK